MAWSIYRQPGTDLYSVWDSVSDGFIWTDCSPDDVRAIYKDEFGRSGEQACEQGLEMADGKRKRYFDRGTYEQLVAVHTEKHGPL